MKDELAETLLANYLLSWDGKTNEIELRYLQLMSQTKYDRYRNFEPGMRFIASLTLWLNQFKTPEERASAYEFVRKHLIFISSDEISQLVDLVFAERVFPILLADTSKLLSKPKYLVKQIIDTSEYKQLRRQSLFLGMSDGCRLDILRRRASLNNEQVSVSYEIADEKCEKLKEDLDAWFKEHGLPTNQVFKNIFLVDDFAGSGTTIIREKAEAFSGRIKNVISYLSKPNNLGMLVDKEVKIYILLYVATTQAVDHINSMLKKYAKDIGYKVVVLPPLQVISVDFEKFRESLPIGFEGIIDSYYDTRIEDKNTNVGGVKNVKYGYAGCGLPLVLEHNTPNNSIALLWADLERGGVYPGIKALFPRISRHREDKI